MATATATATAVAKTEKQSVKLTAIPIGEKVVIARNHAELEIAQKSMVALADAKLQEAKADLADIEENMATAKKNKWRINNWKRRQLPAKQRVIYYEKVKAVLEAGFILVPNFPVDVFAVRTSRKRPPRKIDSVRGERDRTSLPDITTNAPPVGEGEFVDLTPFSDHWTEQEKDGDGKKVTRHYREATKFDSPDFPMTAVKPVIIESTTRAMDLKLFDRMGVLPERQRRSGGDPMIVGQVVMHGGWAARTATFLVAWWIGPEDI